MCDWWINLIMNAYIGIYCCIISGKIERYILEESTKRSYVIFYLYNSCELVDIYTMFLWTAKIMPALDFVEMDTYHSLSLQMIFLFLQKRLRACPTIKFLLDEYWQFLGQKVYQTSYPILVADHQSGETLHIPWTRYQSPKSDQEVSWL